MPKLKGYNEDGLIIHKLEKKVASQAKEIERLRETKYQEQLILAEYRDKLIIKEKAHGIAVNCWMKAEKDLTKEKLRVKALEEDNEVLKNSLFIN